MWATLPVTPGEAPWGGYLYAFNAQTLEFLWNTGYGFVAHRVPPTIAAGKVFLAAGRDFAAGTEALVVYELGSQDGSNRSTQARTTRILGTASLAMHQVACWTC